MQSMRSPVSYRCNSGSRISVSILDLNSFQHPSKLNEIAISRIFFLFHFPAQRDSFVFTPMHLKRLGMTTCWSFCLNYGNLSFEGLGSLGFFMFVLCFLEKSVYVLCYCLVLFFGYFFKSIANSCAVLDCLLRFLRNAFR